MSERRKKLITYLGIPSLVYLAMEVFYILSNVEYARIPWIPGFIFCWIIFMAIYYFVYGISGSTYRSTVIVSVFLFVLLIIDQV